MTKKITRKWLLNNKFINNTVPLNLFKAFRKIQIHSINKSLNAVEQEWERQQTIKGNESTSKPKYFFKSRPVPDYLFMNRNEDKLKRAKERRCSSNRKVESTRRQEKHISPTSTPTPLPQQCSRLYHFPLLHCCSCFCEWHYLQFGR